MEKPDKQRDGFVWDSFNRGTAWLYGVVIHSRFGRLMTAYRKADNALDGGRNGSRSRACAPRSSARLRMAEAMEKSALLAGFRALFKGLFACPVSVYGAFGLTYGLVGVLLYFLLPIFYPSLALASSHLILSALLALASFPLVLTKKTLAAAMGSSGLFHCLLVTFLGIPGDRLDIPRRRRLWGLVYPAIALGLGGAFGALFIHPLVIPLALVGLWLVGGILAYPEVGVVLSTVMLPAVWLDRNFLLISAALILLTWVSYGVKLLCLHRTLHLDLLDRVVLILGVLMLVYGCTGTSVTTDSILRSALLFICLSDYFLIVNLMTTRAYIRRCLLGVGLSVVLVTLLSYVRLIPVDSLSWLEGSRAGDAILEGFTAGYSRLSELWVEHSELYLVLVFPWLYAYLLHTKRLFRRVMGLVFVMLDAALVVMTGSVSALFCVLGVTVLFFLLLDHRWLSVGVLSLPAVGCAVAWLGYLFPLADSLQTLLSRSRHYKTLLRDSLWSMVRDHPAGIGLGEEAFIRVYPDYAAPDLGAVTDSGSLFFEILLSYGWVGLLLFGVLLFLLLQKGLTCLRYTVETRDRAVILGGTVSLVGVTVFGTVRSFITSPRVFFTVMLVIALCSAYENLLFDEYDVRCASEESSPVEDSRLYRRR